ncbi:MAG: histidine kinase, partial [Gammaproteobacteria bacterium]|nr:histidine kinase [Gammaproteobacteria bacterium]
MIRFITRFLQVGLFSTAIAVLIWWLIEFGDFLPVLLVSLSIGWSVHLAFVLAHDWLSGRIGPWLAPIPIVALGLAAGLVVGGALVGNHPLYFFTQSFATLGLALFFGITGSLIFYTRERLFRISQQLAKAELRESQQQKLLTETELKLLQAQIEPHFLFNTLSNIAQLIPGNPELAGKTLDNLTTLLRASLARTRTGETTLGQEIEFAAAYLAIQATRMQGRLRYEIDLPGELRDIPLPPLLVQPLLENAVTHGIEPLSAGGEVSFTARKTGDELILGVHDTGAGISETGANGGTGLRNVRDRLRLRYGPKASLALPPANPHGINAIISIPLET